MSSSPQDPGDLQPLSHTAQAITALDRYADTDLMAEFRAQAAGARSLVPDLLAMSITMTDPGITFTLTVPPDRMAQLQASCPPLRQDAATHNCLNAAATRCPSQGSDGCATTEAASAAARTANAVDDSPGGPEVLGCETCGVMDEGRWQREASGSGVRGIGATLTMPIVRAGSTVGTVDLYAHTLGAFDGLHAELARVCGTWAPGAVSNADLSFATLSAARRAPRTLRDGEAMNAASGYIAIRDRVNVRQARRKLLAAAALAGVDPARLAAAVLEDGGSRQRRGR